MFSAIKNNLLRIRVLRWIVLRVKPDLVISFLGETNVLTIIATRFSRTRVVVNERSNLRVESIGRIWNILRWVLYRFATVVNANTKDSYSVLSRYVRRSKLRLIPNPILLPSHNAIPQRGGRNEINILTVSRCAREKGLDVLLHAIKYLLDQGVDKFTLRIVGDGPCLGELMRLSASIGIEEMVEWCGKQHDVEEFYRDADIFVLASRYEGMPNVLLEAAAYRLPIVVTESSDAVRRFIKQNANGILVPTEAPDELGRALQTLIANPKRRKIFSEKGINAVSQTSGEAILGEWKEALLGPY